MTKSLELHGGTFMTMEDCYQELGGNYVEVCKLLPKPSLIERFTARFLDDPSFHDLCREIEAGNREAAFRAAHTLKGVCANLSFSRLLASVGRLTEVLRPEADTIPDTAVALLEIVRRDYQHTVDTIREYQRER